MLKQLSGLLMALVATPLLLSGSAQAAQVESQPIEASFNLSKGDVAIVGYDPVAYFKEGGGKPTKGDAKRTVVYRGATYRFASDENRALFLEHPSRYEPAYGGWCAYAMASNDRVEVDPKSFRIEGGNLLLFYKGLLANTRKKWGKEGADKLRPKADSHWFKFAHEPRMRDLSAFNLSDGLAIDGYDPVAYSAGTPAKGDGSLTVEHRGATYRFANEANRTTFLAQPGNYEPAYGGWCAYAMSKGKQVDPDPELFINRESAGPFLFFRSSPDLREAWKADAGFVGRADKEWAKFTAR
jgi:YHS domain-containing protein